ncbi:Protein of unknown function [Pyronema omphalodes CBS 100304]|uniref:Uncharacterized protein n=1 Tax=Pyronema omphalodes (strain CBS 100304) TaxID=1076935 RepID=U4LFY8_PYROM|nr:Protein of unknown function [Pyronema omphalodes CBS 100304]
MAYYSFSSRSKRRNSRHEANPRGYPLTQNPVDASYVPPPPKSLHNKYPEYVLPKVPILTDYNYLPPDPVSQQYYNVGSSPSPQRQRSRSRRRSVPHPTSEYPQPPQYHPYDQPTDPYPSPHSSDPPQLLMARLPVAGVRQQKLPISLVLHHTAIFPINLRLRLHHTVPIPIGLDVVKLPVLCIRIPYRLNILHIFQDSQNRWCVNKAQQEVIALFEEKRVESSAKFHRAVARNRANHKLPVDQIAAKHYELNIEAEKTINRLWQETIDEHYPGFLEANWRKVNDVLIEGFRELGIWNTPDENITTATATAAPGSGYDDGHRQSRRNSHREEVKNHTEDYERKGSSPRKEPHYSSREQYADDERQSRPSSRTRRKSRRSY